MRAGKNLILIGMPGAGKSTVGVLLAKALSREFVDTDVYIQSRERKRLQDIIDERGLDSFLTLEARYVRGIRALNAVISTGGSVPYSESAMARLKKDGVTVFLDLPLEQLRARLTDMDSRGIVMGPGQTLEDIHAERLPLYQRYADVTVDCAGLTHEQAVGRVIDAVKPLGIP